MLGDLDLGSVRGSQPDDVHGVLGRRYGVVGHDRYADVAAHLGHASRTACCLTSASMSFLLCVFGCAVELLFLSCYVSI